MAITSPIFFQKYHIEMSKRIHIFFRVRKFDKKSAIFVITQIFVIIFVEAEVRECFGICFVTITIRNKTKVLRWLSFRLHSFRLQLSNFSS